MAFQNVGNITPRANVCHCVCGRNISCMCDCIQTNEIGVPMRMRAVEASEVMESMAQ